MLKILGKNPSGDSKKRMMNSANYKNGSFQNKSKTITLTEDATFLKIWKEFINANKNRFPVKPIPSVNTNLNKLNSNRYRYYQIIR